jgi:hypothetical protein
MKKRTIQTILSLLFIASICLPNLAFGQASGSNPQLIMYRHNGSPSGPIPVNPTDTIGTLLFNALAAPNTIMTGASIRSFITGPVSAGNLPANLVFRTGPAGPLNRMVITSAGNVGIGTMTPAFNLDVAGNTHTSGDFYGRIHMDDNQTTNAAPNTYTNEAYLELKQRAVLGVPGVGGVHGGLMTLAPGGTSLDHQMFFGSDGIYTRRWAAGAANWTGSTWYKLLTGEDIHGTKNRVAKFTSPTSLGDSQIWDDENGVAVNAISVTPGYRFDVNGNARVGGNGLFTGNVSITGTETVTGATTLNGALKVNNTANVTGALTVGGAETVGGTLGVTGNATFSNAVNVGSNLGVSGNANIGNAVTVGTNLGVTGNANVGNALDVAGTAHIGGKVAIGTTSTPGSHALYVGGSMIATEVKVALTASWPDYVFAENTPAPDPKVWEEYIKANKHLPGIPSAGEIAEKGGFELGENQRLLLEKVEQLTLMLLEQQKQIETLNAIVRDCKN